MNVLREFAIYGDNPAERYLDNFKNVVSMHLKRGNTVGIEHLKNEIKSLKKLIKGKNNYFYDVCDEMQQYCDVIICNENNKGNESLGNISTISLPRIKRLYKYDVLPNIVFDEIARMVHDVVKNKKNSRYYNECMQNFSNYTISDLVELHEYIQHNKKIKKKSILNESHHDDKVADPSYEEMVDFLKKKFGGELDDFDLNGGIYYFAADYYNGQFSNLYKAMSLSNYRPGASERGPSGFADREYVYKIYNIKYLGVDPGDSWKLPDSIKFVVKKSDLMQADRSGAIDESDLKQQMSEYIESKTKHDAYDYKYKLISSKPIEESDMMNIVYRSLVDQFASIKHDYTGGHDELPSGEHYDLPPGINEKIKIKNKTTISIRKVKCIINDAINEILTNEIMSFSHDEVAKTFFQCMNVLKNKNSSDQQRAAAIDCINREISTLSASINKIRTSILQRDHINQAIVQLKNTIRSLRLLQRNSTFEFAARLRALAAECNRLLKLAISITKNKN